ncbi:hypothetical protein HPP92_018431 [Vanilla planifolia]|uniref:Uncharacterized protein n=1 Tax=Vanilla planifolia TaxID=51239 RepID=A0A835Q5Q2_VANPL|nr:hypothetical protein HPP92_018431 [Vanilla planifolia]
MKELRQRVQPALEALLQSRSRLWSSGGLQPGFSEVESGGAGERAQIVERIPQKQSAVSQVALGRWEADFTHRGGLERVSTAL